MIWYFTDLGRHRSEREGLEALALEVDWLSPIGWRVDDMMRVTYDADIKFGERIYPISLRYPTYFPDTLPSVLPRGDESRWSWHQFGPGGELCLELGSDNWTSDKTGVDLLRSAYKLLHTENPPTGDSTEVASRHVASLGQLLRTEHFRFLITRNLQQFLATTPESLPLIGKALYAFSDTGLVCLATNVTLTDASVWKDETIPGRLSDTLSEHSFAILRIPAEVPWPTTKTFEDFIAACTAFGLSTECTFILILRGSQSRAYYQRPNSKVVDEIGIVPPQPKQQRLDAGHEMLKLKSVALVGSGSLGSKVAAMLVRSGVGKFILIDDDVLDADNLVRHDLDWRDVGMHKVDGVARRLKLVNPDVKTHVRRIQLAGQEASNTAETALKTIGECDLIIDATADPAVLNLLSAIATAAQKPIVWAEVFGGGIGGLIARYRPGIEPTPQYMRLAIENWFAEKDAIPVRATRGYGADRTGIPLIANDADVTAIAAPAARFAIDTLLNRDPSIFPYPIYVIGLAPGSVIVEPFQTFPIPLDDAPIEAPKPELTSEEISDELARVLKLFAPK